MSITKVVPRFRGNVFETGSGWSWEVMVTIGQKMDPIFVGPKAGAPPLLNKDAAMNEMKKGIIDLVKIISEILGQPIPDELTDLNVGMVMSTEEFSKPIKYRHGEL